MRRIVARQVTSLHHYACSYFQGPPVHTNSTRPANKSLIRAFTAASNDAEPSAPRTSRIDPTAKRPTKKCDPYGQGGKPMSRAEAESFMTTISSDWKLQFDKDVPVAIHRHFAHADFMSGAKFLHKVAAIAQTNAHYPSLSLDRRIHKNSWNVVSSVQCHTQVLQGLSANDFHLAMLIDVEVTRPETQGLLLLSEEA